MSELIGADGTLFSLWPEHVLCKPNGLDWSLNQPVVLLDDGRVAFVSDSGKFTKKHSRLWRVGPT